MKKIAVIGSGISGILTANFVLPLIFPSITDTKLGQKPSMQEKSLLHEL